VETKVEKASLLLAGYWEIVGEEGGTSWMVGVTCGGTGGDAMVSLGTL
jgi:hypothetical protein